MINLFIVITSILLFVSQSPFFMSVFLILFSLGWSMKVYYTSMDWFFYSLIIMFLGGMMIMFTYASSLASIFKPTVFSFYESLALPLIMIAVTLFVYKPEIMMLSNSTTWMNYLWPSVGLMITMVSIIIITLFIVVKLVQINEGPLKMK